MTKLLGLVGRKQSGKNTAANWIFGNAMVAIDVIEWCKINKKGQLVVPVQKGEEIVEGIFDCFDRITHPFLKECVWPLCKIYSFADPLKEFCINVLGLDYEMVYGTDKQKNKLTHLRWENMPGVVDERLYRSLRESNYQPERFCIPHDDGQMTGREVLQYFGTNIIRKMYGDAWVNATLNKIEEEQPQLAIICDVRFPNEIDGIHQKKGRVIKLTRAPFQDDEHNSEKALDNYPEENFDAIIDNRKMTIAEQNESITKQLNRWRYLPWSTEVESDI